uniref:ABC transporter domain-containing protein n=1 Tax=Strigamia maritima TaxID=126957 RepID=T1JB21_STRMM
MTSTEATSIEMELTELKNTSKFMQSFPEIVLTWTDVNASCIQLTKQKFFSGLRSKATQINKFVLYFTLVNGLAKPRELLAIMGASGAGKTTLLNILTKKNQDTLTVSGQVNINNQRATKKMIATVTAFVQQDNLFIGTLTVKEQLIFQARLTLGNTTYSEKLERVDQVIQELGLSKCQNTLIGIVGRVKGISGGEKLRLAIACELLTNPPMLFCDEPTSGLDASMAQHVMTILRNLALKGKTVICTIHQPSSKIYAIFDKILFLAEGRVAYLGSRQGALEYFDNLNYKCPANYNPADYFIHTLTVTAADDTENKKSIISEICNSFEKSDDNIYKVPWTEQFRAVLWRSSTSVYREPILIKVRILQTFFVGLLAGVLYYRQDLSQRSIPNINGVINVLIMNISYQNLYAVIQVFCSELPIFLRDHSSGLYGAGVYFLSKILADQFIFIISPFVLATVSYWLIGFNPDISKYFIASLIYILVANAASSFGYLISSISTSTPTAIIIGAHFILVFLLFGGFYIHKNSFPWYIRWISNVSWCSYGYEALAINQWKDVNHIECNLNNNTCLRTGLKILQEYDINAAMAPAVYTIEMSDPNLHEIELNSKNNQQGIILTWNNLNVHYVPPKKCHLSTLFKAQRNQLPKQILNNVSGLAKPGELLAIMGSSGAGKTTLLNILTMKNQKKLSISGEVFTNNQPMTSKSIATMTAYIQQDNLFIGTLTVKEQLIFQARLTMGDTTYPEKLMRVDEVIQELGLSKCQDTLIGIVGRVKGISGGEKRRLAVACELLTDPYLLFCDEPTSGLDTAMAQSVVTLLQTLAMKGKTVICTIHQPSSEIYALFDKVLFLAEGRLAYLGSRENALEFFENLHFKCPSNYNPADYFIHTLAITPDDKAEKLRKISEICDFFEKSDNNTLIKQDIQYIINNEKMKLPDQIRKSRYKVPWVEQFRAVMWRSCLSVYKDPMLIKARLLQSFLIGLILGLAYYHQDLSQGKISNVNGAIYILLINITYQNMFAVINVFSPELPIFMREHTGGLYGPGVYFFCKTFADVSFVPEVSKFFWTCLIIILVANAASSFGYLFSSICSTPQLALSIGPSCIVPLLLFGGYFLRTSTLGPYVSWISNISWFSYGFETLLLNQWKDVKHIECNNLNSTTCKNNGLEILDEYKLQPNDFLLRIFELLALVVCIRLAAFLAFAIRAKIKARLTMGNTTYSEKLERVDQVIQELGLAKCQDTLIGIVGHIKGISGGEKRRLAIGCEILTISPLLVCDEPTSGLDSHMAQNIITILQNLAMKGKTVVCTIHQPSSEIYANFDNNKVTWIEQFRAVMWRSMLCIYKEPIMMKARFLQAFLVGLCLGFIYYHQELTQLSVPNINSAMFILLLESSYYNMFAVIHVFCSELPIFLREHSSGLYGSGVYFFSKTFADQFIFIITPIIFTTTAYWLIGFNPNISKFFITCLIFILVANASSSYGYLISAMSSSTAMALAVAPSCVTPLYLFGGFFIRKML